MEGETMILIEKTGRTWGVYKDGVLVEGGFFRRLAAEILYEQLVKDEESRYAEERKVQIAERKSWSESK
jgi:hypothetical protein